MSQPADDYAARLGSHTDWGLTRDSFAPLRDELADHLSCIRRDGTAQGKVVDPSEVVNALNTGTARRALTSTRIADQVYATLHRWPTKQEWRELAWLGLWFLVILFSDFMAHRYNVMLDTQPNELTFSPEDIRRQAYLAWALQAFARAGFFTLFATTLVHAWRVGKGVLLARILQLKLIHTALVIGAFYAIGNRVYSYMWNYGTWQPSPAIVLTAPLISGVLIGAGILIWALWRPRWALALGFALLGWFSYSGGPINYNVVEISQSIVPERLLHKKELVVVDGKPVLVNGVAKLRIPDEKEVLQRFKKIMESNTQWALVKSEYDFDRNVHTYQLPRLPLLLGSVFTNYAFEDAREWGRHRGYKPDWTEHLVKIASTTPMSVGGAGLGWLAAPIPFLGVVGLLGLLALMGRRSHVSLAIYAILSLVAIASTIMPFFVVQDVHRTIWFNANGMVAGPFPGFDSLFVGGVLQEDWMLILGLGISAIIPWLLTALFLKPTSTPQPTSGPEVAT